MTRAPDDGAKLKDKMIYAASKSALTASLEGISVKIEAKDLSDVDENEIREKCRKFS